jgi:hypothetical protein
VIVILRESRQHDGDRRHGGDGNARVIMLLQEFRRHDGDWIERRRCRGFGDTIEMRMRE